MKVIGIVVLFSDCDLKKINSLIISYFFSRNIFKAVYNT